MKFLQRMAFLLMLLSMVGFRNTALAQGAPQGTIQGSVFEDLNENGARDPDDPPLAKWQVTLVSLSATSDNPIDTQTTITDDRGGYTFTNVTPGAYNVIPALDSDYDETRPGGTGFLHVDLADATPVTGIDFGFHKECVKIEPIRILCDPEKPGGYLYTFQLTNLSPFPLSSINFLQASPPVTVLSVNPASSTPNIIPVSPALPTGQSQTFTVRILGATAGEICFPMSVMDETHVKCCFMKHCVTLPGCECVRVFDEKIICNPDGASYSYTFTVQNLTTVPAFYLVLGPPPGVSISPGVIPLNPPSGLPPGGTQSVSVTITGASPGKPLCFYVSIHDQVFKVCCSIYTCIKLPDCNLGCALAPGVCAALKPSYTDKAFSGFTGTIAAITCWSGLPNMPVLAIMNLDTYQSTPPPLGVNWSPTPLGYHGPVLPSTTVESWNRANLGTVFGLTIDNGGNIYVSHTSAFNGDFTGPGGPGAIYKIANGTGAISVFVGATAASTLPNLPDPSIPNPPNAFPGLGNVSFDYDNKQIFTTDEEDGKIYRIDMAGNVQDSFDPMLPDNGLPGFAPLGERLWAVQYHRGRVYYSVWVEDGGSGRQNPSRDNEIRSVAIFPSGPNIGKFDLTSDRLEVTMPNLPSISYSSPVSDISFSPEGYMAVAERTMISDTDVSAHVARGMEFRCDKGIWKLFGAPADNVFKIGFPNAGRSGAGGLDYDYSPVAAAQLGKGRRVWWTGDCIAAFLGGATSCEIYGLEGLPLNGGDIGNAPATGSILLDLDNNPAQAKTQVGDVEIPCPAQGGPVGTPTSQSEKIRLLTAVQLGDKISFIMEDGTPADAYRGDLNSDGKVNVSDAVLALRATVGLLILDEVQVASADITGAGKVNIGDVIRLLRFAVGLT